MPFYTVNPDEPKNYGLGLITIVALAALGVGIASFGSQDLHKWWTTSDTIKKIGESGSIIMMAGGGVFAGIGVIGLWLLNRVTKPEEGSESAIGPSSEPSSSSVNSQGFFKRASSLFIKFRFFRANSINDNKFTIDANFNQSQLEELLSAETAQVLINRAFDAACWTAVQKSGETYYLLITQVNRKNLIQRVLPNGNSELKDYTFFENLGAKGGYIDLKEVLESLDNVIFIAAHSLYFN